MVNRGARTAGAQDGEGGSGGYGRQVGSPLHNRQKGQIDIMPRSNRAGRAISVTVTVYRERGRERRRKVGRRKRESPPDSREHWERHH